MFRSAVIFGLFGSLALMAQTSTKPSVCGPIGVQAQMMDATALPVKPSQLVRVKLTNLGTKPIVRERITIHYKAETPTSGAPSETESSVAVEAKQEAVLAQATSTPNPVSFVEVNSVSYADGSGWKSQNGEVCKAIPEPLPK